IASGMLATADKMAIALSLGADLIYVERAAMNTVGCINAGKCQTNNCPVGVTSHLPHLEIVLVVEEKRFRTANYLNTYSERMFMFGASCGNDSPYKFSKEHNALRESNNNVSKYKDAATESVSSIAQITRIEDVKSTKEKEEEKELVRS